MFVDRLAIVEKLSKKVVRASAPASRPSGSNFGLRDSASETTYLAGPEHDFDIEVFQYVCPPPMAPIQHAFGSEVGEILVSV